MYNRAEGTEPKMKTKLFLIFVSFTLAVRSQPSAGEDNELREFREEVMEELEVIFLKFRTYISWQTVKTQIRLFLEEQSDQGVHCLYFHLHRKLLFLRSKMS